MRRAVWLWAAAGALCWAQGQPKVTGYVLDPSGASVAGAMVRLECEGQPALSAITGVDGYFAVGTRRSVRSCQLEVRHRDFQPVRMPAEGVVGPLRIRLDLARLHQQVRVEEEPARVSVDPGRNVDTIEVDASLLESLPVMDLDVLGTVSQFLDQGAIGTSGYSLVVDGVETTDLGVSPSAIQEVKINTNPYSAEFYRPGRGRIEVTTTRAAAAVRGTFNVVVRDHRLDARNAFAVTRPPEHRRIYEGHVTGPLSRDGGTAFLLTAEYEQDDEWPLIYAQTPSGPVAGQIRQPDREKEFSFGIDHRVSDSQSISVRYEYERESALNLGAGGFDLPETAADEYDREHDIVLNHRAVIRGKVLSEMRVRLQSEGERTVSRTRGLPRIVVHDAFSAGGAQEDRFGKEYGAEFHEVLSWNRGKHYLRAGAAIRDLSRRSYRDLTERDGTFYFSSLEDYAAGKPYAFVRQQGDGGVAFWNGEAAGFVQDDWRPRTSVSLGLGLRYEYFRWPGGAGNLAPRFSVAYAPGQKRSTVVRAGAGLFYDDLGSSAPRDSLLFDGKRLRRFLVTEPGYPDPAARAGGIAEIPSSIVRLAQDLRAPVLLNYSAGIERQLWRKTTLAVTYTGAQGRRLFRSRDLNAPRPPEYERPDATVGVLRQIESAARSASHALEVAFRGNLTRVFQGGILYTFGRAMNDTGGADWLPADSYDLGGEWARADHDRRHRFRTFGRVRFTKLFELGLILSAESGRPYSITTGRDDNRDGRATDRPAGVRRNSGDGPGGLTLDLRWSREFRLPFRRGAETRPELRLAVDAFNVLNRVNYTRVVGNLSSPFFGEPVAAGSARRLQLSLQFKF